MALYEIVQQLIKQRLGVNDKQIKLEARFVDDLGADSLEVAQLIMEVEERFNIDIPDNDSERLRTVGELVKYLETHLNQGSL